MPTIMVIPIIEEILSSVRITHRPIVTPESARRVVAIIARGDGEALVQEDQEQEGRARPRRRIQPSAPRRHPAARHTFPKNGVDAAGDNAGFRKRRLDVPNGRPKVPAAYPARHGDHSFQVVAVYLGCPIKKDTVATRRSREEMAVGRAQAQIANVPSGAPEPGPGSMLGSRSASDRSRPLSTPPSRRAGRRLHQSPWSDPSLRGPPWKGRRHAQRVPREHDSREDVRRPRRRGPKASTTFADAAFSREPSSANSLTSIGCGTAVRSPIRSSMSWAISISRPGTLF